MIVAPRVCVNGHFVPVAVDGSGRKFCPKCGEVLAVEARAAAMDESGSPRLKPLQVGDPV